MWCSSQVASPPNLSPSQATESAAGSPVPFHKTSGCYDWANGIAARFIRTRTRSGNSFHPLAPPMKPTTKIRFTEPQIAFVMRAHPNCNLDRLTELCFEFDQAGKIINCVGTIKSGRNVDHDYAGSGLARLYETARRQLTARRTSATILQFPNGGRRHRAVAGTTHPVSRSKDVRP